MHFDVFCCVPTINIALPVHVHVKVELREASQYCLEDLRITALDCRTVWQWALLVVVYYQAASSFG